MGDLAWPSAWEALANKQRGRKVEAEPGIEPGCTALQAAA